MRMACRRLLTVIAACSLVAASGCQPGKRLTKANVDEVAPGMSKKQVESILGLPSATETQEIGGVKVVTYTYAQGTDTVTAVFRDDKLQTKQTTLTK